MRDYSVTCAQMKVLEKNTDEAGLSYYQMMENAGTIAAHRIVEITATSPINDAKMTARYAYEMDRPVRARVYCGKGNNGGDGFVVARLLQKKGWGVELVLVDGEPTTPDAITNYHLIQKSEPKTETDLPHAIPVVSLEEELAEPVDVVVDAIYGTGFHGRLRENGAKAAAQIAVAREQGARVFALDIPSGMGGDLTDEEELDERCVRADVTITFHAKKPVHLQTFAAKYCGKILVADIGIVDPDAPNGTPCETPRETQSKASRETQDGSSHETPNDGSIDAPKEYDFGDFVDIIAQLRAPGGCPWDREQTHQTLKKYLLEETQEAADAIDNADDENLCEELGDVLLQVVLHAQIGKERGAFTMEDVIQGISEKMIRRHPWVFGDAHVETPEQGEALWEQIKAQEKEQKASSK